MHAMWANGTFYCGNPDVPDADLKARAKAKERKLLGLTPEPCKRDVRSRSRR